MTQVDRLNLVERCWTWRRLSDGAMGLCTDEDHANALREYPGGWEVQEFVSTDAYQGAVEDLADALAAYDLARGDEKLARQAALVDVVRRITTSGGQ